MVYYLLNIFKKVCIVVLEKGWLGFGNIGWNMMIICLNYLLLGNEFFYEFLMKLWENFEQEFNFNVMVSQCGILNLIYIDGQCDVYCCCGNVMIFVGVDVELLDQDGVWVMYLWLNFDNVCFLIKGGLLQCCVGMVCYDGVVWGYVCGVDCVGVDLIQNCEVIGFCIENGVMCGVDILCGYIVVGKVGVVVVGLMGWVMVMVGMWMFIESYVL